MPPKDTIELSEGQLYIKVDDGYKPIEIGLGDVDISLEGNNEDDIEPVIKFSQEPMEFTFDNAEFAKGWTLATCKECGYQFPITKYYALLCGTTGWTCPRCRYDRIIEDFRKKE